MKTLLTLITLVALSVQAATKQPNVILFLVDDMGWMDCGVYGSEYYETPHMDKLAKQSMLFTDAYAHPLCSPTRASILSGQYPSRHGITTASGHQPARPEGQSRYPKGAPRNKPFLYAASKNYLDPKLITLPEVLREAGYSTGHFGKWHIGLAREHWPEKHGFQVAFHAQPSPGPPRGNYFSPYGVKLNAEPSPRSPGGTITDGPKGEYITDRLTDESIAFIEANKDKPFYLNLWHYGVHGPWGHKEEYTKEFAKKKDPRGEQRNPIMASMLKSIDESLGRVLAKLDELGLTKNTIFIFYSDNGGNVHSNVPGDQKIAKIKPGHPRYPQIEDWQKWAGPEPPTNNAPSPRGQGPDLRGWAARAPDGPLARAHRAGLHQRRRGRRDRLVSHLARCPQSSATQGPPDRRRIHPPRPRGEGLDQTQGLLHLVPSPQRGRFRAPGGLQADPALRAVTGLPGPGRALRLKERHRGDPQPRRQDAQERSRNCRPSSTASSRKPAPSTRRPTPTTTRTGNLPPRNLRPTGRAPRNSCADATPTRTAPSPSRNTSAIQKAATCLP